MPDKVTYLKLTSGPASAREVPARKARCIRSEDLFDGQDEVVIDHNGRYYLLRKQKLGGLVLTGLDDINLT
jgi:hemin uptake protein HemP